MIQERLENISKILEKDNSIEFGILFGSYAKKKIKFIKRY
jgi:predicted nucleotidyltransferase